MIKICDNPRCRKKYEPRNKGFNALKSRFCSNKCRTQYHREKQSVTNILKDNHTLQAQLIPKLEVYV